MFYGATGHQERVLFFRLVYMCGSIWSLQSGSRVLPADFRWVTVCESVAASWAVSRISVSHLTAVAGVTMLNDSVVSSFLLRPPHQVRTFLVVY